MTDKEVMQMALNALETPHPSIRTDFSDAMIYREKIKTTIEALRTALAKHDEQIDIKGAEMNTNRSGNLHEVMHQAAWDSATRVPEGDIRALKYRIHELEGEVIGYKQILDTQPEQKPVAYLTKRKVSGTEGLLRAEMVDMSAKNKETHDFIPLYTAPPQRIWQGLTDEEIKACAKGGRSIGISFHDAICRAEAKLKDKNNG